MQCSSIWRKMLTVEPVIFFYSYGLLMNVPIYQQYVYFRLSEERGFPYSFQEQKSGCGSKTLNDSMEKLEKEVQSYASYVQLGTVMFSTFPSIVITLFMGGWTDKVGRRPALILPVVGSALDAGVVLIVIYAKLPIYCLFVGALIHGLCGYYTAILFACVSYIADTTEQGQIAFRLGILEFIIFVGGMAAQLSSGFWIENLGFSAPYWFILGCEFFAVIYAVFFVPESRCKSNEETGSKLFSLDNFKSSWRVFAKAVGARKRNLIVLTLGCGVVNLSFRGISGVLSLFMLYSPLCFSPKYVGYFLAFWNSLQGVGGVVTIKAFGMCLSKVNVLRISMLSYLGFLVFFGFSTTPLMVFLSPLIGILGGAGAPVLRAMMSEIVSADDQGSLFSASASVEILFIYLGALILNSLYAKSLKFDEPGFVFFLAAALLLLPLALTFCLKDLSMFKNERKLINQASGYESITDCTNETDEQNYSPNSLAKTPEDPLVIPDSDSCEAKRV
ncbi:proton-coupled folate transporter-like [Montipora capricornis]|uniref:proton-coupled folate transporter-like n=1 Tax=Montipora capricornis TaxID=246305 RepID=UPI0035F15BF6